jgi:AraC-like DNA-binding protein
MSKSPAEELLLDFQTLTHMSVALYDEQFRCIYNLAPQVAYCSAIHRSKHCLDRCIRSDDRALEAAKNSGTPQRYRCPYGLWEGIYPIRSETETLGYLFVGPALEEEQAKNPSSLLSLSLADAPDLDIPTLTEGLRSLPTPSDRELSSIDRLLCLLTEYIAEHHLIPSDRQTLGHLIRQHIQKNLSHKITLTDISRRFHCSTVTLTETFRREFGMTIMQYVSEERMKLGANLLATTALSVGEIAERCGFPDVEYFSRCFKQKEGISPSVWRRSHIKHSNP